MTKQVRRRRPRGATIRTKRIMIKVTQDEKDRLQAGADSMGLSMGAYLVHIGLLAAPEPRP